MERTFRLIRGKKEEHVVPFPQDDRVWYVVKDGPDNRCGDIVCARRPEPIKRAAKRVSPWRTRVTSHDLVLLWPTDGWQEGQELASPYKELARFLLSPDRPDPRPVA